MNRRVWDRGSRVDAAGGRFARGDVVISSGARTRSRETSRWEIGPRPTDPNERLLGMARNDGNGVLALVYRRSAQNQGQRKQNDGDPNSDRRWL